jgi:hypothetical protein
VIATQVTDVTGEYDFTDLTGIPGTGHFTVKVVVPAGFTQNATQVAHNPGDILLSRGGLDITGQNFALLPLSGGAGGGAGGAAPGGLSLGFGPSPSGVEVGNPGDVNQVLPAGNLPSQGSTTTVSSNGSDQVLPPSVFSVSVRTPSTVKGFSLSTSDLGDGLGSDPF